MKRIFLSAAVALLMAVGLSSAPAEAGTIKLLDSLSQEPGGQGAGDTFHSSTITDHSWEGDHKFGSKNTTFNDSFKFKATAITGFSLDIHLFGVVSNITINLYSSAYNPLTFSGGSALITPISLSLPGGGTSDTHLTFTDATLIAALNSSAYNYLVVTGKFCGCAGYQITMTPVPPALIMFLTALGGLGVVGFFRMKKGGALLSAA